MVCRGTYPIFETSTLRPRLAPQSCVLRADSPQADTTPPNARPTSKLSAGTRASSTVPTRQVVVCALPACATAMLRKLLRIRASSFRGIREASDRDLLIRATFIKGIGERIVICTLHYCIVRLIYMAGWFDCSSSGLSSTLLSFFAFSLRRRREGDDDALARL